MKPFRWNPQKNKALGAQRGISFERIVVAIESGGLLDILSHPNQEKYPRQRVLVVNCNEYAYLVPFIEEDTYYFLKTVIPSRKATRDYLKQGESRAED
ncbi:MAG: toxin [Pseudomonadota bacterium]